MVKLKHYSEIIRLGKKLVAEFSKTSEFDTTTQWMSHYLAEVMHNAENEPAVKKKKLLQKECSDIILSIWTRRKDLPNNLRPTSGLAEVVKILRSLNSSGRTIEWFARRSDKPSWGAFLEQINIDAERITRHSLYALTNKKILTKEKQWLKFPKMLSADEKQLIEGLDLFLKLNEPYKIKSVTNAKTKKVKPDPKKQPGRLEQLFDSLEAIINSQSKDLKELKGQVQAKRKKIKT